MTSGTFDHSRYIIVLDIELTLPPLIDLQRKKYYLQSFCSLGQYLVDASLNFFKLCANTTSRLWLYTLLSAPHDAVPPI